MPYLSIVIPFRNDAYIENALAKFNFALNVLIHQLEKQGIDSEIIIVDWNPPDIERSLAKGLHIDQQRSQVVSLVIYEVPNSIHRRYRGCDKRALVGEVAFNVGIRRSRGAFIVGKVADSFYSDALVTFLGKKKLSEKHIYRVDRVDVVTEFPIPTNWERHFASLDGRRKSSSRDSIHTKACGDFLLMHRWCWLSIKGFPEADAAVHFGSDGEALYAAIGAGVSQHYLSSEACVYKIAHDGMYEKRLETRMGSGYLKKALAIGGKGGVIEKAFAIFVRLILAVMNLPETRISGIRTRSVYRYYLVANLRRFLRGGGFMKSSSWGLGEVALAPKFIVKADWESSNSP